MKRFALLAIVLCIPASCMFAQSDSLWRADSLQRADSLRRAAPLREAQPAPPPTAQPESPSEIVIQDTVAVSEDVFVMAKSPLGAVLRSAVIPGWGQYYTENYIKIPVILGLTGFLVYGWIHEHGRYAVYRDLYDANINLEKPQVDLTETKQWRELFRNRRDTYAWWFGVTYLLQIADAFAGAHLYDFDVSDEVQLSFRASAGGALGLQLSW